MRARVLLLATLETKREEVAFLADALATQGLASEVVDLSLGSHGEVWDGAHKIQAIAETAATRGAEIAAMLDGSVGAVVGIGGGTGGEIILKAMHALPYDFPKVLITTLPFDPREAVADNSIILVPTLVDIAGLNPTLRRVFTASAMMIAGLVRAPAPEIAGQTSIGVTALGATGGAAEALVAGFRARGEETTVFHAQGFGGAAFARFAEAGAFKAIADMTVHELNRLLFVGDHVPMPTRFTAAGALPRVVLPGGLNFLGLGVYDRVPAEYRARPHYRHSGHFTHVKVTEDEMHEAAMALAGHLNAATGPVRVIVPMGGFSHRDCPGGEIEDPGLRQICLDVLTAEARHYEVEAIAHHINAPETASRAIATLMALLERSDNA